MKQLTLIALVVVMVLIMPATVLAQDDAEDILTEEFASEDELLVVYYPEDWFIAEVDGLVGFILGNTEELLTKLDEDGATTDEGDKVIRALVLPMEFLTLIGLEYTDDMELLDLAESLVGALAQDGTSTFEEFEIVEVEDTDLEIVVVGFSNSSENTDGTTYVWITENDLIMLATGVTHADEYDQEFADLTELVLTRFEYNGTSEDIMNVLMGGE